MSILGGTEIAADVCATSADHLDYASNEGIQGISKKETTAVLLPTATFSMMTNRYANARLMIDSGVPWL